MAEDDELNLPPGFRFLPTDEELITFYLKPKILGRQLPCNIVEEKQLYGDKVPWEVFNSERDKWQVSEISSGKTKKSIYVFAKLEKKKKKKKKKKGTAAGKTNNKKLDGKEQFVRAAGCGTWDGQTGPKEIRNGNGEIIGVKRMLVFEIFGTTDDLKVLNLLEKEKKTTGYWIMHEYSIYGVDSDYVLCEISRNERDSKIRNPKPAKISTSSRQGVAVQSYGEDSVPLATSSGVEEREELGTIIRDNYSENLDPVVATANCNGGGANDHVVKTESLEYEQADTKLEENCNGEVLVKTELLDVNCSGEVLVKTESLEHEQGDTKLDEDVNCINGEDYVEKCLQELWDDYLVADEILIYQRTEIQSSLLAESFEGGLLQQNSTSTSDIKELGKRKTEAEDSDAAKRFCKKH